jgi:hypothetical protein
VSAPSARPSWYALETGGWRDYVTLLHPPYTLWHLSYVVIGAALAPPWYPGRLGATLVAFFLAVGIGAHALDELHGHLSVSGVKELGEGMWKPGLGVFPGVSFGPHWDALDSFVPGLSDLIVSAVPEGATLLAIDENTAVIGDGADWAVMGVAGAHVYRAGAWTHHPSGSTFAMASRR